ncbi:Uncharacterised protein [Vibrio cholerae]|nr:Uncharacterised protein [Vibrio cholerae]CSI23116.1 Uncharacterised protein [Vibrio cholerae]
MILNASAFSGASTDTVATSPVGSPVAGSVSGCGSTSVGEGR